jgi:hypothetical protein
MNPKVILSRMHTHFSIYRDIYCRKDSHSEPEEGNQTLLHRP